MWKLLMNSRKFREMVISLIAAAIVLAAGLTLPRTITSDPETMAQIRTMATIFAGLIVAGASAHVLGIAIEDAGEKASGRDPGPPEAASSVRPPVRPVDMQGYPRPPAMGG